MRLIAANQQFFEKLTIGYATAIRLLLNVLLSIIVLGLVVGIFKAGYDLLTSLDDSLESILQSVLLDTVFIVALVEIAITILGYLKDGYVHVRYIVDTILIIMLNEIVSMWFKHPSLENSISLSVIVVALAAIRVSVVYFAPKDEKPLAKQSNKLTD